MDPLSEQSTLQYSLLQTTSECSKSLHPLSSHPSHHLPSIITTEQTSKWLIRLQQRPQQFLSQLLDQNAPYLSSSMSTCTTKEWEPRNCQTSTCNQVSSLNTTVRILHRMHTITKVSEVDTQDSKLLSQPWVYTVNRTTKLGLIRYGHKAKTNNCIITSCPN